MIMRVVNLRISNDTIPEDEQRFNDKIEYDNGERVTELCTHSELRESNIYFELTWPHNYTQVS